MSAYRARFALLIASSACGGGAPPPAATPPPPEPEAPAQDWRALDAAWSDGDPIPDFELVDQDGKGFRLRRYASDWVLVGFVFSRCPMPEACPRTMSRMAEVQRHWTALEKAGETRGRTLELLTLTLDPVHDRPEVLRAYGERFGADFESWTLATGPGDLMREALPSMFRVLAIPQPDGNIDHTVMAALLRPGLAFERDFPNNGFDAEGIAAIVLPSGAPRVPGEVVDAVDAE